MIPDTHCCGKQRIRCTPDAPGMVDEHELLDDKGKDANQVFGKPPKVPIPKVQT
jgi:hypothetical protein